MSQISVDRAVQMGLEHQRAGRAADAEAVFRQILGQSPNLSDINGLLGILLVEQRRFDEAIAYLARAIEFQPDNPEFHFHIGLAFLARGTLNLGWPEFEWRLRRNGPGVPITFSQPRWDGGDLRGRTILLNSEQNVSDTIQFVRYALLVAARGGRIVVACQNELVRLLANNPHLGQIFPIDQPPPPFDVHCPLMSLPLMFGTTQLTIPAYTPYLAPPESLSQSWAQRLGPRGIRKRVGIVCGAGTDSKNIIPSDQLAPLLGIDGVEFHSLQKNSSVIGLIDHRDKLGDFAEVAALIGHLDLVICVDSPIAHLAGALNKPVWLLLNATPDWRWMSDRADSPWYSTMRIFCRAREGDWRDVVRQVATEIRKLKMK